MPTRESSVARIAATMVSGVGIAGQRESRAAPCMPYRRSREVSTRRLSRQSRYGSETAARTVLAVAAAKTLLPRQAQSHNEADYYQSEH